MFDFIFFSPKNILFIFASQMLHGLTYGVTIPILWAMIADVADYSEWRTKRRATAIDPSLKAQSVGSLRPQAAFRENRDVRSPPGMPSARIGDNSSPVCITGAVECATILRDHKAFASDALVTRTRASVMST